MRACLSFHSLLNLAFVHRLLKTLMVVLAVLTVGAVQLFGTRIGYLCGCTGDFSQQADCQPTVCHSTDGHQAPSQSASVSHDSTPACGGQHQHSEVRDTLPMTTALALQSLPAPVFFELPDVLQAWRYEAVEADQSERLKWLRPAEDRSPPAALVVAGTVVMMV
jgi:hypothetical protein